MLKCVLLSGLKTSGINTKSVSRLILVVGFIRISQQDFERRTYYVWLKVDQKVKWDFTSRFFFFLVIGCLATLLRSIFPLMLAWIPVISSLKNPVQDFYWSPWPRVSKNSRIFLEPQDSQNIHPRWSQLLLILELNPIDFLRRRTDRSSYLFWMDDGAKVSDFYSWNCTNTLLKPRRVYSKIFSKNVTQSSY